MMACCGAKLVNLTAMCGLSQGRAGYRCGPSFVFEQMALQQDLVLPDRSLRAAPSDARQLKALNVRRVAGPAPCGAAAAQHGRPANLASC